MLHTSGFIRSLFYVYIITHLLELVKRFYKVFQKIINNNLYPFLYPISNTAHKLLVRSKNSRPRFLHRKILTSVTPKTLHRHKYV